MPNYYRIEDPSDVRDIGDQIAAWLEAGNPKAAAWAIQPPKPAGDAVWAGDEWILPPQPVPESVTAWQIRRWLISQGISLAQVDAAIAAIPDPAQREAARVDWEYAPYVERSHPMLPLMAAAIGIEDIDAAFIEAASL